MTARKIYLASSWRNVEQPILVKQLRDAGHAVYDFRHPAPGDNGFHWSAIDPDWLAWTPETYRQAVETHPLAADGYGKDKAALDWADTGVLLLPSGRSAHLEAGYLIGQGKPVAALLHPDKFEPELMYLLAARRFEMLIDLLEWLDGLPAAAETAAGIGEWVLGMAPHARAHPDAGACRLLQEVVELAIAAGASVGEIDAAVRDEIAKADSRNEIGNRVPPDVLAAELADVQILTHAFAAAASIDLRAAVDAKMAINRQRHWHVTKQGTLYSRPAPQETSAP